MRGSFCGVPADGLATGDEGPFPRRALRLLGLHLDGAARAFGDAQAAGLGARVLDRHRVTQAGEVVGG